MQSAGQTRYQLIDEDGDELPGTWEFSWEARDPFEAVMAAITEVSAKPWKYSGRRTNSGRFSPDRCKAMLIRVTRVLKPEHRGQVAAVIARVINDEFELRPKRAVDPKPLHPVLAGKETPGEDTLEGHPELIAALMLRQLHDALKTAVDCGGALRISWQVE
jgi:hypothetical protein